ncbi:HupE/UreJ family protein [Herbaspirillum sp. HC18]|nr:HupE/UreJ family protein [Herbaspirillum sp. HC18]
MAFIFVACSPLAALAHSADDGGGFVAGLTHPIFGPDHLLAMVAVGIFSAQIGGRHIWVVPATFVCSMVVGAIVGIYQVLLPYGEFCIALSVLVLGASIAIAHRRVPLLLVYGFISLFGVFHGHVHGVEMPHSASPAFYSFGFLITTSTLHLTGVGIGKVGICKGPLSRWLRLAGGSISLAGLWFALHASGIAG